MPAEKVWHFIQWCHYLALSLWVGGIALLSGVVAPAVHRSMASRVVAGEIVAKVLRRLNIIEIACCFVLLATSFLSFRFITIQKNILWLMIVMVLLMGGLTGFYSFYLAPQMASIKASVSTLDSLSENHPSKIQFNQMHRLYVILMSLNLILGLVVLYSSVIVLR